MTWTKVLPNKAFAYISTIIMRVYSINIKSIWFIIYWRFIWFLQHRLLVPVRVINSSVVKLRLGCCSTKSPIPFSWIHMCGFPLKFTLWDCKNQSEYAIIHLFKLLHFFRCIIQFGWMPQLVFKYVNILLVFALF